MEPVNQILLVDKDNEANAQNNSKIKKANVSQNVKIALNGGHALLYLEQLNEKLQNSKVVVLLNMDTPIMNGYEFLNSFNLCKNIHKENILLIVLKDNLTEEKIQNLRGKGINHFIENNFDTQDLVTIINNHFSIESNSTSTQNNSVKLKNKFRGQPHFQSMNAA